MQSKSFYLDLLYYPIEPKQVILLLISAIVTLVLYFVIRWKRIKSPYEKLDSVLSPAEKIFYKTLAYVVQDGALIMAKVRIADLVKIRGSVKSKYFWGHFSKISQKHIDFVLIDPNTFKTLCVIELDDKSHLLPGRIVRDRFVNQVMVSVGIPLYRFKVRQRYNLDTILSILHPSLTTCKKR